MLRLRFILSTALATLTLSAVTDAFAPSSALSFQVTSSTSVSALQMKTQVDAAVALYQKKFPQNKGPRKRAFNAAVGMPVKDLDGTKLKVAKTDELGTTFSERPEADLRATYGALSQYFGDDAALQMVKDFTLVLTMNRKNLKAIMDAYASTFGKEEADNMVKRNPGLLFCQPSDAATADNLTMQFSYVVAVTRPAGPLLLYGLLTLLFEPTFELVSGIPLRSMLFANV